jgi:tetratricopeptide (TPR) repeat protein
MAMSLVCKKLAWDAVRRNLNFFILFTLLCFVDHAYSKTNPVLDFAKQQIKQKFYLPAISTLNTYLETHPKDVEALYWKGFAYYKVENYIAAEENYTAVIKLDPKYLPAYEDLAAMKMKQKNYAVAVTYFNPAIALDDSDVNLYNSRGMCYYYLDKFELAIKDFNAVLKLDPANYLAYNNKGSAEYNNQNIAQASIIDLKTAEKDFNIALKLKPDFQLAFRNRGIVRYYLDSLAGAAKDLLYAVQLDPKDENAHFYMAKVYFKQNQLPVAMQFYDNAIGLAKYKSEFYIDRGICKMEMGNYSAARADFYKAMQLSSDTRLAEYQTARSFAAEGKKNDAIYALREAKKAGLFNETKYFGYINKDKYFVKWAKDKEFNEVIKELKFGKK